MSFDPESKVSWTTADTVTHTELNRIGNNQIALWDDSDDRRNIRSATTRFVCGAFPAEMAFTREGPIFGTDQYGYYVEMVGAVVSLPPLTHLVGKKARVGLFAKSITTSDPAVQIIPSVRFFVTDPTLATPPIQPLWDDIRLSNDYYASTDKAFWDALPMPAASRNESAVDTIQVFIGLGVELLLGGLAPTPDITDIQALICSDILFTIEDINA